jgi:hypothetical protein
MHVANMCMATMLAYDRTEELDGCSWYWVAVLADCTVGVLLTWLLLAALRRLYQRAGLRELAQFGCYGEPPDLRVWYRQCFDFQVVVVINKLLLLGLFVASRQPLGIVATRLLGIFDPYPRAKLVLVMLVTPMVMNIFAFWVIDNLVMADSDADLSPRKYARPRLRVAGWKRLPVGRSSPERPALFTEFEQWKTIRECSEL